MSRTSPPRRRAAKPPRSDPDAMRHAVALLRMAVELRTRPKDGLDAIVQRTVATMGLDDREFRAFLAKNMAMLARETARPHKEAAIVSPAVRVVKKKIRSPR